MRRFVLTLFALAWGLTSFAQDAYLQNFESDFYDWGVMSNDQYGYNWEVDTLGYICHSGVICAFSPAWTDDTNFHYLVTPEFNVADDEAGGEVSFWVGVVPGGEVAAVAHFAVYMVVDEGESAQLVEDLQLSSERGWYRVAYTMAQLQNAGLISLDGESHTVRFYIVHYLSDGDESFLLFDDFVFRARDGVYTIQFDANGGEGYMDYVETDEDGYIYAPDCDFTAPEGYTFVYWYTEDLAGDAYAIFPYDDLTGIDQDMIWYAIYGKDYTVNYHSNSGEEDQTSEDAVQYAGHEVLDNNFSRDGYVFSSWNTEADGSGETFYPGDTIDLPVDSEGYYISDQVDLYAQWVVDGDYVITIYFEPGEAYGDSYEVNLQPEQRYTIPACMFHYEGYRFIGWNSEYDGSGVDYQVGEEIVFPASEQVVYIYAQWEELPCVNITFYFENTDGDTFDTLFNTQEVFVVPDLGPQYGNNIFVGWNTEYDGSGITYNTGDRINISYDDGDVEFYAQWQMHVTIHFDANGGNGIMADEDAYVYVASGYELPECAFYYEGHAFDGWNTRADGEGDVYWPGDSFYDADDVPSMLYAQWYETETYTIHFDANGGSGVMNDIVLPTGDGCDVPGSQFTYRGYSFSMWNTEPDGSGTEYHVGDYISEYENITLYAQWVENEGPLTYAVYFQPNGGAGTMHPVDVEEDEYYTLPECLFTYQGYSFVGWSLSPDGTSSIYPAGTELLIDQDYTFYAIWIEGDYGPEVYTVSFSGNGGSGVMQSVEIEEGEYYTLPACAFSLTGYAFAGWSLAPDGSGAIYMPGSEILIEQDMSFYAIWIEETGEMFTITFHSNQGMGSMPSVQVAMGEYFTLPACQFYRNGYLFAGWSRYADGSGTRYSLGDVVVVTGDYTFYAIWEPVEPEETFTITFYANGGEGTMNSVTVPGNTTYSLPNCTYTRVGFRFVGWCVEPDGSDVIYAAGTNVRLFANTAYYAIWAPVGHNAIAVAEQLEVRVYPNPVADEVHIEGVVVDRLEVIDLNGRTVLVGETGATVNMAGLNSGIYLLRIHTAGTMLLRKVTKR